jgi:3-hydroxyisobutyrate dehydrogenase-like beta-hydroxyacid dehydrogenase
MKAGFIGLGNMGQGMVRNLVKGGHELLLYNRTRRRAEALAGPNAVVVDSPAEACARRVVMTMLADDAALESVALGANGIVDVLPKGGIHVSHSTISVALAKRLTEAHRERGQLFVSAPVFGRPDAAEAARLLVVAAGPPEAIEKVRPLLEPIGRKLVVLGPDPPSANALKLGGNFLLGAMVQSLSEAFALMRKHGVTPGQFLSIVNGDLFQSPVLDTYGKIIIEERFEPAGFKMQLGLKDVRLALAASDAAAVPMPVGSVVRDHFLSGIARGYGDLDWSAVSRVVAEDAGLAPIGKPAASSGAARGST